MEFCAECGTQNDASSSSCISCGASLSVGPAKGVTKPQSQSVPTVSCPSCSSSNPEGTVFCGNCGSNVNQTRQTTQSSTKFCGDCGSQNSAGNAFCGSCGKSMNPAMQNQVQVQSSQPVYQPVMNTQHNYQQPQGYQSPGYQQPQYQPRAHVGYQPQMYRRDQKSVGLAVLISFFLPGFGQMYAGAAGRGIAIFIATFFLFFIFGIGIFVYLWQLFDARDTVHRYNRGQI